MSKFIVTSGSHFTPFTYDELVKPIAQYTEAYNTAQQEADTLAMQAGAIGSMLGNRDVRSRELFDSYMNDMEALVNDMQSNGYNIGTARELSALRRRYGRDMTKINAAITRKAEDIKSQDEQLKNDKTLMFARNARLASVDDYLDDPYGVNNKSYSGAMLSAQASELGKNLGRDLLENMDKWSSILGGQYFERNTFTGFHANEVQSAIDNTINGTVSSDPRVALLQKTIKSIYDSSGMSEWANNIQRDQAYKYIGQGLYSAVGSYNNDIRQNANFLTDYQKASLALKAASSGGGSGNSAKTLVGPKLTSLRGNILVGPEDRKQNKLDTERKDVIDALKKLRDMNSTGTLKDSKTGSYSENAMSVMKGIAGNKYWKDNISGNINSNNIEDYISQLEKEDNESVKNKHFYAMEFTPATVSNIARGMIRQNIGSLSGGKEKDVNALVAKIARRSNGDISASDLSKMLDSDHLSLGYDIDTNSIILQKNGADSGEKQGQFDDRPVFLDADTVLQGASAYVNAGLVQYVVNEVLPEDFPDEIKDEYLQVIDNAANSGATLDVRDVLNLARNAREEFVKGGKKDDRLLEITNALIEGFAQGLFNSTNTQWAPNTYNRGWSVSQGDMGSQLNALYEMFMQGLGNEDED